MRRTSRRLAAGGALVALAAAGVAYAAIPGGNSGTRYSSWNRNSVVSQSLSLSQPDFRNCQDT